MATLTALTSLNGNEGLGALYDNSDLEDWEASYGGVGGSGAGWESLSDQDLAGFPAGDGSGNGWEEGGNPSDSELEEYFLTGSSTFGDGASVSLGAAYGGGELGDENLVFQYVFDGQIRTAPVTYVTTGSIATVPEPTCVNLAILCFGLLGGFRLRNR